MKKRFSKLTIQKEIRTRVASGESHQSIYEDLTMLYHNNQEIAKMVRDAFKNKTRIKDVRLRIK